MSAHKTNRRRRRGTAIVEQAIVCPMMILLFLGTFILGLGVFRYQQISMLAREGARWASVHGPTYQAENPSTAPITSQNVYNNAVAPKMVGLNPAELTCTLTPTPMTSTATTATVTVTYYWVPESLFSPITFSSTSTMPITY
jgi:Flp pilus assembly protein TadG